MKFDPIIFNHLYFYQKMSLRQIAPLMGFNSSSNSLIYHVKKAGIILRNKSQSIANSYSTNTRNINGKNNPNYKNGKQIDGKKGQRWSKYNISKTDFNNLLKKQDNKCALCLNDFKDTPSIDHCHESGKVRGLLCNNCNRGLGMLQDSPIILKRALKYLDC